jgi:ribonuclease HI
MTARRTKIFFDGGCRPNPGPIEVAVVAGGAVMIEQGLGEGSSLDAEWLALIAALRFAWERGIDDFVLLGDSASVVAQAMGRVPARGAAAHLAAFRDLACAGPAPRVRHIGRAQNLAGIALAKLHPR